MGVKRAIATAEKTMNNDDRVTILNEIVHNDAIVERFAAAGVKISRSVDEIDRGTIIISAHGASPEIYRKAAERGLKIVDATCPLVLRIHRIIKRLADRGCFIIHFGDAEHDETVGIIGHVPDKVAVISSVEDLDRVGPFRGRLALTSQTTAQVSDFARLEKEIRRRYPRVEVFNTICNATSQRQRAIMELAPQVDIMLIVGSQTSANSKRLLQISRNICPDSHLINAAREIRPEWFEYPARSKETVGLTAGASTPDFLIQGVIERLRQIAGEPVEVIHSREAPDDNELAMDKKP